MRKASSTPNVEPRLLSIKDAARVLGVGVSSVWLLIADGKLKAIRVGRRRLVPVEAIDAFIRTRAEAV
jgi:excisionase family DNA binding protein